MNKEKRALNLVTEAQQNSFFAEKTKDIGITSEELAKVMNSAFVLVPYLDNVNLKQDKKKYHCHIKTGVLVYHILFHKGEARARLVKNVVAVEDGTAPKAPNKAQKKGKGEKNEKAQETKGFDAAYLSCVEAASEKIQIKVKELPEFRLTAQLLDAEIRDVTFGLGSKEGLRLDDKYDFIEYEEDTAGNLTSHNIGWSLVSNVGKPDSQKEYQSEGLIIGGSPYQGLVVCEHPTLPININLGFGSFQSSIKGSPGFSKRENLSIGRLLGPQLDFAGDIGPGLGVNQLFLALGSGCGFGTAGGAVVNPSATDSTSFTSAADLTFNLSLYKKFYFRRLALVLDAGLDYSILFLSNTNVTVRNNAFGGQGGGGLEFAFSPSFNIGAGAQWQLFTGSNTWSNMGGIKGNGSFQDASVDHSGLSWKVYLSYTPSILSGR